MYINASFMPVKLVLSFYADKNSIGICKLIT